MLTWFDMAVHLGVMSDQHLPEISSQESGEQELFSIQVNEFGRGTKDNLGEVFAKVKGSVLI